MNDLEALKAAREYFAKHGGLKHDYFNDDRTKCCALGALIHVTDHSMGQTNRLAALLTVSIGYNISTYNDDTDKDAVLRVYDKAIATLENVS